LIERHYATVDTRWGVKQIHYRRCGSGPAALLLHQSPQSSGEYEPLMREWSDRFTVIAPDYPGFGMSDPLGDDGELELGLADFAEVLVAFLDEIGVQAAPAYGFHTGAGMAVAMADHSPAHITAVYGNGYAILNAAEQADILAEYLPPFEKHWDGSHLVWLWARNRDQVIFFPWFARREDARIARTIPPPIFCNCGPSSCCVLTITTELVTVQRSGIRAMCHCALCRCPPSLRPPRPTCWAPFCPALLSRRRGFRPEWVAAWKKTLARLQPILSSTRAAMCRPRR